MPIDLLTYRLMIKYPASYARMRGLKGKLLEKTQLEGFLGASDIRAITSVLSRTVYGEQLRESMDLPQIEHGLKQDLILSYMKILTFLRGKPARFLEALLGEFELLNLKSIIRSLARESQAFEKSLSKRVLQREASASAPRDEEGSVEPFIFSLGKYHTIPIEEALEADDLESFVSLMGKTPFARPLEIGYQQYTTEGRLFPLELALDLDYYGRIWQAMDDLGPLDKYNAGRLLGIRYDITNMVWILRLKEYYKLPVEQVFQYIISHGWKIRGDTFWKIAVDGDVTGAISTFRVSPYDEILRSVTNVDGSFILGVEICLSRYLYRESLATFLKFPLQAAQLVAFFICKEMQIRDIITILAGRHLGLPQDRIRAYTITL